MDIKSAKEFLIARVVEEAKLQQTPLTKQEETLLWFTEEGECPKEAMQASDELSDDEVNRKFEAKITSLFKSAYKRDQEDSPAKIQLWTTARQALAGHDHYILVMMDTDPLLPSLRPRGDSVRLLFWGVITAVVFGVFVFSFEWVKEHVFGDILPESWGGAIFVAAIFIIWSASQAGWLSKIMIALYKAFSLVFRHDD
ncbi:MAG: hypothetical protein HY046_05850 [Acidobacteria bacterium]|nr:hypothetical protein [Acidobacteriota bacterium]